MGCSCSLAKADHCRFSDSAGLDINSRLLQQLFHCDRSTSFLGVGRILVFFVRDAALGHRVLRLPRPMLLYVFGHELTHAIWTWLMGGKVRQFRVSRTGGYVVTDTNNFWISLAPYFFPIYSILALLLYGGIGVFVDVEPYRRWLFGVVGFTWSFHVTFAIWMLWQGQTDLIEHGTFFSMMVIYLINFSALSVMLIVACRDVTFQLFRKRTAPGRHGIFRLAPAIGASQDDSLARMSKDRSTA